jgi:pimeloyl-ACP methyl ester carboxylesterase
VNWDYIASGEGGEGLLLLPGGAMVGEAGFTRIPAFEDRYRVIAPDYPYVSTAALLLDGLGAFWMLRGSRTWKSNFPSSTISSTKSKGFGT